MREADGMPPVVYPNLGGLIEWVFSGPGVSGQAQCTMHAQGAAPWDSGDLAIVRAAWVDNIIPLQTTVWTLVETTLTQQQGSNQVTLTDSTTDNGDSANTPMPPSVAIIIRKLTGLSGRANRGRMYVPGIPENHIADTGRVEPGALTSWNTAADGLAADLSAGAAVPSLFHRATGTMTPLTELEVAGTMGHQRMRVY